MQLAVHPSLCQCCDLPTRNLASTRKTGWLGLVAGNPGLFGYEDRRVLLAANGSHRTNLCTACEIEPFQKLLPRRLFLDADGHPRTIHPISQNCYTCMAPSARGIGAARRELYTRCSHCAHSQNGRKLHFTRLQLPRGSSNCRGTLVKRVRS